MRKLLTARIALVLISMGMIACGDNGEDNPIGPAGPEAELAGTWIFEDTDFVEVLSDRFVLYLVEQGMSRSEATALVDGAFEGLNERLRDERSTVRLNPDKTWEDDRGNKGTWRIDGVYLISTDEDGMVARLKFFLDGNDLTIILTKAQFLAELKQDDDFDAQIYELYNDVMGEDDVIRFFYKRKS